MNEQNNTSQGGSSNRDNRQNKMPRFNLTWLYIAIAVALGYLFFAGGDSSKSGSSKSVTYTVFKQYVEQGYATRIVANKDEGTVRLYVKPEHIRDVFQQGLEQTGKQTLHILSDIAGLRERRRVCDRKGNVQKMRHSLRKERLSASGRTDELRGQPLSVLFRICRESLLYRLRYLKGRRASYPGGD